MKELSNEFNPVNGQDKKPETSIENAPENVKEKGLGRKTSYNFEEIGILEAPIENLVRQLWEAIISGKYDVIIGDDAAGRIPTLVIRKIMEVMMRESNPNLTAEEDREKLKTFFVAGGVRNENNQTLLDLFKKIKPSIKNRALVVTEYIFSGSTIGKISALLEEADIPFDTATVLADKENLKQVNNLLSSKGHNLLFGQSYTGKVPRIYQFGKISGVLTRRNDNSIIGNSAHAMPYRKALENFDYSVFDIYIENPKEGEARKSSDIKNIQKSLNEAREDVDLMADRILKKIKTNK